MKKTALLLVLAMAGGAALSGGLLASRAFAPPSDAVRSVDISRLLQEFEPVAKQYEALRAKYQAQGDRLRQISDAIKSEKGALAQLDKSSEEYAVRSFQVQLRDKGLEEELNFWTEAQRRENEALLDASVRRIHAACEDYGKRTGVSAVIMRPGPLPGGGDPRNSLRDLESRWIIWSNPDHDVTDAVLAILREQG